jgi:hypothetical protein
MAFRSSTGRKLCRKVGFALTSGFVDARLKPVLHWPNQACVRVDMDGAMSDVTWRSHRALVYPTAKANPFSINKIVLGVVRFS